MPAVVRLIRLKCVVSDDSVTDEIKVQQDGRQVWPGTGSAFHSISTGTSVDIGVLLTFNNSTNITLFDQEDFPSTDDRLGTITIHAFEAGGGEKTQDIVSPDSRYTLTYKVANLDI